MIINSTINGGMVTKMNSAINVPMNACVENELND